MNQLGKISYKGWPNCYRLTNGRIELIINADVGPRIIHFGFVEGVNEFAVLGATAGLVGGDEWRVYGGHRLWHAPEAFPRTYFPDNQPAVVPLPPRKSHQESLLPTNTITLKHGIFSPTSRSPKTKTTLSVKLYRLSNQPNEC